MVLLLANSPFIIQDSIALMSKNYFAKCRIQLGAWTPLIHVTRKTIPAIAVTSARFIAITYE
jgi:hypothetical protein